MVTITLTREQVADVLKQAFQSLGNGNGVAASTDIKTAVLHFPEGEKFSTKTLGEKFNLSTKSAGMRLIALKRQGYVKKIGGGNWKRV